MVEQNPKLLEQEIHRNSLQDNFEFEVDWEDFIVSAKDNDNQVNAFKDRTGRRGAITVFSHGGLELKKTLIASMGSFNPYLTEKNLTQPVQYCL